MFLLANSLSFDSSVNELLQSVLIKMVSMNVNVNRDFLAPVSIVTTLTSAHKVMAVLAV